MENQTNINNEDIKKVSAEVLDHMMNPRNYGAMEDATSRGKAIILERDEYVIIYLKVIDGIVENITFGMDGNQDTSVAGSIFTEMVKGDTLENGIKASRLLDEKLNVAPKKQQACSRMVIKAFEAALKNKENRDNGQEEDMYTIDMKESCEGVNIQ